ncbi:hypothetical protein NBRC111894_3198 [Sporolactobacillus inulinus]|uniref:Uncharacterized protein n=1 Tax=Sporolactobacillus inulinus TaxID=2078 RepID=A0A4Y1ZFC3_9BACL|nr:hypothetical protein NBRC111894_3198 [Sporolactobacillus inulinus]
MRQFVFHLDDLEKGLFLGYSLKWTLRISKCYGGSLCQIALRSFLLPEKEQG